MSGYIYLLQKGEYVNTNQNIYKIGKTSNIKKRLASYIANTILYICLYVDNYEQREKQLIECFNKNFKIKNGNEEFEGNLKDMLKAFTEIITMEIINPINIFTITKDNIDNIPSLTNSKIEKCDIDDIKIEKLKYHYIIRYIYKQIGDGVHVIKNNSINIKIGEKKDKGFHYIRELGISFQSIESNKAIKEIFNQCKENNIKLYMKIKTLNEIVIMDIKTELKKKKK